MFMFGLIPPLAVPAASTRTVTLPGDARLMYVPR
jgi:hypothetical protein